MPAWLRLNQPHLEFAPAIITDLQALFERLLTPAFLENKAAGRNATALKAGAAIRPAVDPAHNVGRLVAAKAQIGANGRHIVAEQNEQKAKSDGNDHDDRDQPFDQIDRTAAPGNRLGLR